MGLTLGCARCHDHKFDPIPTRDYYALAGIFASTKTLDGEMQKYVSDFARVPLPEDPAATAARATHAAALAAAKLAVADAEAVVKATGLFANGAMVVDDRDATLVGAWKRNSYSKPFHGRGYLSDDDAGKGTKSATFAATLPTAGLWEARLLYSANKNRASNVPVTFRSPDGSTETTVNQRETGAETGPSTIVGQFDASVAGAKVSVVVRTDDSDGYVLADAVVFAPVTDVEQTDPAETAAANAALADATATLKALTANAPPPAPTAFGVMDFADARVGDTAIRVRGEARQEGEVVPRGFLSVCGGGPAEISAGSGRLELARWVTRPDHPLTARVFVNRVWGHLFGHGIVRTADNFGALGAPPTHPELLDRLAADFVADGWQTKPLVRRLVMSRTYRLSSVNPDAAAADADNDLFARADRRRLTAEALRDTTLHLAGRLDETPPGVSPVAGFARLAVNVQTGVPTGPAEVASLTVRSVYLPLIRNELPDALTAFDFADPEAVTGVRPRTNGPAQSLFLLNAPQVRDRAAAAAERYRSRPGTLEERVAGLYRAAFSRDPRPAERDRAVRFLEEVTARNGEAKAWTDLTHVLFCSAEFRFLE